MIFRLRIAFAVLWLCCSCALSAQIGFSLPVISMAVPGVDKNIPVKVTNFDSIVSMQYVIRWNPSVLKFVTVNTFGAVPGLSLSNFNSANALDSGYVKLQWEGSVYPPGIAVSDGTTIFRLRFTVIGPDTSSSPIKFTEITNSFPATFFEVVKVNVDTTATVFEEQQCNLTNGFVAVGYTVATEEPTEEDQLALAVSPNPFSQGTRVEFFLEKSADVQIMITDATGRVVMEKTWPRLGSGQQGIDIDKAVFPAKGAYFLTVRTGSESSVRTIISH